jgi:hypothetical protein
MKQKGNPIKVPTEAELAQGLSELVTAGLMEIVPGKEGQPGFRLTKRGEEYVEKKFPQVKELKNG